MPMLTFTEEILLLLGDEEGMFLPVEEHTFDDLIRRNREIREILSIEPLP